MWVSIYLERLFSSLCPNVEALNKAFSFHEYGSFKTRYNVKDNSGRGDVKVEATLSLAESGPIIVPQVVVEYVVDLDEDNLKVFTWFFIK